MLVLHARYGAGYPNFCFSYCPCFLPITFFLFPFLYELRLEKRHGVLAVLENWNRCFDGLHGVAVIRFVYNDLGLFICQFFLARSLSLFPNTSII